MGPPPVIKEDPQSPFQPAALGTRGCVVFLLCSQWRPVPLGTSAGVPAGRGQQRASHAEGPGATRRWSRASGDRLATRTRRTAFVRPAPQRSWAAADDTMQ